MSQKKILEVLNDINQIVFALEHETDFKKEKYALLTGDSLFSGNLGLILYHLNRHVVLNDTASLDRLIYLLQNVLDRVENNTSTLTNFTLSYGLSGLGMVINQLVKHSIIEEQDIELGNLDVLISEWIAERIIDNDSEFMHGAFGAIQYLSSKKQTSESSISIDKIIDVLFSKSIIGTNGIHFELFNKFIPDYPKDSINLSLSHGLSGILIILSDLFEKGLIKESKKDLILQIAKFLREKVEDVDFEKKIFCHTDSVISPEIKGRRNTRLAWCYGDLNQVIAFLRVGQALNDESYISLSYRIGTTTVRRRQFEETYISDSQFCHGTSGLAEVYHYLYEQTKMNVYLDAKKYWLDQTLEYLGEELKTGYYEQKGRNGELLEGLIGVALVLMSEVGRNQNQKMLWNNIFLLN
jgi:hypothetical protein